jgi:zinc protease
MIRGPFQMRLRLALAAAILLTAALPARLRAESPDANPHGISRTVLDNGLEVIVVENRAVPLVTVQIAVRNGAFTEPPELDGLSHLYEHMFFKGNAVIRSASAYKERELELGASSNATTGAEVVRYFMTVHKKNLFDAAETLRDAIRYPLFSRQDFLQELPVVLGEFDRNEASPMFHLWREVGRKRWYEHFSRKNPLGDRDVITNATREQMKLIQHRYYVPNNSALIVGGDVIPGEVFDMARHLFGDWPASDRDPFRAHPIPEHPPLRKTERIVVLGDIQTATINIAWHGPSLGKDDEATFAADVLSYVLAQPDSTFQRNLVDAGLVDAVELSYGTLRHTGPVDLMASTSPDRADAAWAAIQAELARLTDPDYITDEQIESAKNTLEIQEIFSREQTSQFSLTLGFWWSSAGLDYYLDYIPNLRAVDRRAMNRFVRTYITGKPRVEAMLLHPDAVDTVEFSKTAGIIRPATGTSADVLDAGPVAAAAETETFNVDGLPVVLRRNPESDVVVAGLLIAGGLPHYGPDNAGREALLLGLLDKGSENFSREDVNRRLARTGASISGEARHDYSAFTLRTLARDFADNFALFADAFTRPLLDETEFNLERERRLNAIAMRDADPDSFIAVLAGRNFYAGHPYAVPPDGLRETLEPLSLDDLRALHADLVNRNRLTLFVMGNLTADEVRDAVAAGFSGLRSEPFDWPRVPHDAARRTPPPRRTPRPPHPLHLRRLRRPQLTTTPTFPAAQVAASILSDRLYEEVRTRRNLTYAVASVLSSRWANYGVLYVTAARPNETVAVMLDEVRRIVEHPVSDKEVRDKIEGMITRDLMGNQATESQVARMMLYEANGGGWANAADAIDRIRDRHPRRCPARRRKILQGLPLRRPRQPRRPRRIPLHLALTHRNTASRLRLSLFESPRRKRGCRQ